jgi:hypothetical protein
MQDNNNNAAEDFCPKWNKHVTEASCNICKDQCNLSIADPDNFIAKKLIVNLELVKANRSRYNFDEDGNNKDIIFLKTEIEEEFKQKADSIIDALGLAHLITKNKEKDKDKYKYKS